MRIVVKNMLNEGMLTMKKKTNAKTANIASTEGTANAKPIEISAVMRKLNEALNAVEQYKTENPEVDVDIILSAQNELYPILKRLSSRELDKFVTYAKEQGTKMPFDSMEMGILAAGRRDMQDGLAEIVNSLKFEKPTCSKCDEGMDNRGRSKKKIITSVGEIEINPIRFECATDNGQSAYPMLDFIGLIEHEETLSDGTTEKLTVKCTRNAAASIALACSESSYEQAALVLNQLAGLDLTATTEFRVTDSVGSEFVKDVPSEIEPCNVLEMTEKISSNILGVRIEQINGSTDKDEIIQKALDNGPAGILRNEYDGSTIKVMYVQADGTGVPGRRQELAGVKGKQPDGSAKTFEAKIGAVFIVEFTPDGRPLLSENGDVYRDKKVIYMGTVRKADDFGAMLYQHAIDNGLGDMDAVVFLGDGAKWLWGIQQKYFPYAFTGIDLYHSTERVNTMIDLLQFKGRYGSDQKQSLKDKCVELLRFGKVQDMLNLIESTPCKNNNEKKLESAMGYFSSNVDRMNYGVFAACGIFVGSGVIEAGCKVIVGNRMKNAGMHWSKDNAEKMINLRCAIRNGNFLESYLHDRILPKKVAA